jgi:hypothetical protein
MVWHIFYTFEGGDYDLGLGVKELLLCIVAFKFTIETISSGCILL